MGTAMTLFLLDGPSGTGKTTLVKELLQAFPTQLQFCRRVTTRSPRPGEMESAVRDYDFVTPAEFAALKNAGELALWREFDFGMSYGLPRKRVDQVLNTTHGLALCDLGTAPQARTLWKSCVTILLCTPMAELARRLQARGGLSPDQIAERLANATTVLQSVPDYDYVVINRPPHWALACEQLQWILTRHLTKAIPQPQPAHPPADATPE